MTVELLDSFETPELLAVKPTRNKAEYCWTCGPSVTYHFLTKYNLPNITYLDADLFFFADLKVVFDEISDKSIAITEHNSIDDSLSGRFCVQFMYFKNDKEGLNALTWWRDCCIDWCFAKYEDGKFGDQRYVDAFPKRYNSLCIIDNKGAGIAPWNMNRYYYNDKNELMFQLKTYKFIFFHMHGIKVDVDRDLLILNCVGCFVNDETERLFYRPYADLLLEVFNKYLGGCFSRIEIRRRRIYSIIYSKIKLKLRNYKFAKYIYYNVLKVKYNGYESKKC
ncbi:MAG: hypothetical protein AB2L20_09555 [Mangrovibacterium sp.]